jgi:NCS1 family nucleobase:cation symporter-1
VYSGALSIRNVFPRLDQRWVVLAIVITAVPLAAWLSMARYESFLFLLGSVFVPLFGVLGGHLLARQDPSIFSEAPGRRPLRWDALVAWLAGFVVYHWIAPIGPPWWTGLSRSVFGAPVLETVPWLPASIPSFVVGLLAAIIGRRAIIRATHVTR